VGCAGLCTALRPCAHAVWCWSDCFGSAAAVGVRALAGQERAPVCALREQQLLRMLCTSRKAVPEVGGDAAARGARCRSTSRSPTSSPASCRTTGRRCCRRPRPRTRARPRGCTRRTTSTRSARCWTVRGGLRPAPLPRRARRIGVDAGQSFVCPGAAAGRGGGCARRVPAQALPGWQLLRVVPGAHRSCLGPGANADSAPVRACDMQAAPVVTEA